MREWCVGHVLRSTARKYRGHNKGVALCNTKFMCEREHLGRYRSLGFRFCLCASLERKGPWLLSLSTSQGNGDKLHILRRTSYV